MIVVHAVMRSRPERRAETRAALVAAQRATRDSDAGCLHYAFVVDLDAALVGSTEGPAEIRVFDSERTRIPE